MQLDLPGRPHLAYCTNIHAGETWSEIETALASYLPAVKEQVSPDQPMGIGLRLSGVAARELLEPDRVRRFRHFLAQGGFYVFTVNAFPYGSFHGQRVKEQVYEPDWRTSERLRFTNQVADLLARIAPEDVDPTISTVPGGFKANISTPADVAVIADGFVRAAAHLHVLQRDLGRTIVLAIEPEPACFLETTNEVIGFLKERVFSRDACQLFSNITGLAIADAEQALYRHVGLCFDVCHSAVEFEETVETLEAVRAAGIAVAKIQLSSALRVSAAAPDLERLLSKFDDGIYLHQTVQRQNGALTRHTDLPAAFAAARGGNAGGEWRVHCHVPVFVESFGDLGSTQQQLRDALGVCRKREVSPHLEVETYTWSVLPDALKSSDLVSDIVRELKWVRAELGA
jgi:hypothetical protein